MPESTGLSRRHQVKAVLLQATVAAVTVAIMMELVVLFTRSYRLRESGFMLLGLVAITVIVLLLNLVPSAASTFFLRRSDYGKRNSISMAALCHGVFWSLVFLIMAKLPGVRPPPKPGVIVLIIAFGIAGGMGGLAGVHYLRRKQAPDTAEIADAFQ